MELVDILVNQQRIQAKNIFFSRVNILARSLRRRKQQLQAEVQQLQNQIEQINVQHQQAIDELQMEAVILQGTIDSQQETLETYRDRDYNKVTDTYPQELESILDSTSFEYFKDQYRRHCVLRPLTPRNGTAPLRQYELEEVDGESFSLWLREQFRQVTQNRVTSDPRELRIKTLKLFIESIKSRSALWRDTTTNEEIIHKTHLRYESSYNRNTSFDVNVYVDLGDQQRNIIRVSRAGVYDYGAASPVNRHFMDVLDHESHDSADPGYQTFFQRYPHQKPLYLRRRGTREEEIRYFYENIFRYIRIIPDQRALFIGYLVSCLASHIQHPILAFFEPQNHGKRTAMRFMKQLIDDSTTLHVTKQSLISSKGMDIVRQHYWIPVNNVEKLTTKECETLYNISTGIEDYFNQSSDFVRRCLAINGPHKPKMTSQLEKNILRVRLERISNERFQTRSHIESSFEQNAPRFRMALLHLLSGAIGRMRTSVSQSTASEEVMADDANYRQEFERWSRAAVEALAAIVNEPTLVNAFDEAHRTLQEETSYEQQDNYPLVELTVDFLQSPANPLRTNTTLWESPPTRLLFELVNYANNNPDMIATKDMPSSANELSKKLAALESNFMEHGIRFSKRRTRDARLITFTEEA